MELTEQAVLDEITDYFHFNRQSSPSRDYWWKWCAGWGMAQRQGWPVAKVRRICRNMESRGLLQSRRISNVLLWSCPVKGYKQHQFKDYYEKE